MVLTSTHNLCFRAKIRKNVYPCKPQFYYIKVGCKGVFITRTCFHDVFSLSESSTPEGTPQHVPLSVDKRRAKSLYEPSSTDKLLTTSSSSSSIESSSEHTSDETSGERVFQLDRYQNTMFYPNNSLSLLEP